MLNPLATDWLTRPDGLAPRLQALRTDAGLTGTDLADRAGWHQSKVSRIETGKQLPSVLDIRTWAGLCDATDIEAQELLDLLGDVQAVHLDWKRRTGRGQVAVQASYSELVEGSKLIRHFETAVVPGLLQTSEYARCIAVEAASIHGTDDDPDQVVAAKLQRQRFLYDSTKQFEFLMAEPVLRGCRALRRSCEPSSTGCRPSSAYRTFASGSSRSASDWTSRPRTTSCSTTTSPRSRPS